jgi:long-chain acyl-CoA synthetase
MLNDKKIDTLGDLLTENALKFPQQMAVINGNYRYTWHEVNNRANSLVHALLNMGIKKGDRIATLTKNKAQFFEVGFAVAKIGAILVPLNYRLVAKELVHIINDSGANTIILDDNHGNETESILPHCSALKNLICIGKGQEGMEKYEDLIKDYMLKDLVTSKKVKGDDLASIVYTSGTTGNPKGVMFNHKGIILNLINNASSRRIEPGTKYLHVFPPFFSGGLMNIFLGVHVPLVNVIMDWDVKRVLETIEKEKIEVIGLAPTMIIFLLEYPNLKKYDLSSLKTIYYAGSSMPIVVLKKALEQFKCNFMQFYGSTETGVSGTILDTYDHVLEGSPETKKRIASVGKIQKNVEARIVDEDGNDVALGELGEVVIKTPGSMIGYWNLPEETEKTLKDGFVYTGDIGAMDEDGYLYIVDRKKDMIISGGINIYPSEIEKVIYQHGAVSEVAVIGVPDEQWGEAVKALVTLKRGKKVTEDEIIELCRKNLASFKKPRSVEFVEAFPKNSAGKILKKKLKDKYWEDYKKLIIKDIVNGGKNVR